MKKVSFLLIALILSFTVRAQQRIVLLDNFFNNEFKKNSQGELIKFHYLWDDTDESGYSKWGAMFQQKGFSLQTLTTAPTITDLSKASVYVIVDPDTDRETSNPNTINQKHVIAIRKFIQQGGIVVVMANDSINADLVHLNLLTKRFGITLNADSKSKVYNDQYEMAAFQIPAGDDIFTTAKKVYLKEVSSLTLSKKAKPILTHHKEGYTVAAVAPYGKGKIIVVGDPWFYNEYLNGRLGNNNGWDNDKAAADLVAWIALQCK
jgi:unsaturated rhamnogalacturonyl hydrolase